MRIVHISTIHRALDVRIFYKECRSLAKNGYEVHLLIPNPPHTELEGVFFHAIDKVTTIPRLQRTWRRLNSAYQLAVSLNADIYHFHDPELIPVGILLKRLGAKVIYDVHENTAWEAISLHKRYPVVGWLKFGIWTFLESLAKVMLDAFICVTPAIGQKFPPTKTFVVYNFPLTEEFQDFNHNISYCERPNNIAYVGGITKIRAIREMVCAMELLAPSLRTKLMLIGEFSSPELQTEVEQLLGWEKVKFFGWQSRSDVVQYLAKARLGLVIFHPERDHLEALPNKLFEYMAAGLPVIASDFPLWREIVQQIDCGLLVNPLDPKEIAQATQYLLEHPEEAEAMGKRGYEAVTSQYNWETESEKLLNLYKQLQEQR
ncbi:MAG: glycosyltransferase family 4 protein [Mastigocoleus sp. MO_167.B18]|nr:glycosyltransferase family 4 protein [Mastigocoleus sp. MO_167.B18]